MAIRGISVTTTSLTLQPDGFSLYSGEFREVFGPNSRARRLSSRTFGCPVSSSLFERSLKSAHCFEFIDDAGLRYIYLERILRSTISRWVTPVLPDYQGIASDD